MLQLKQHEAIYRKLDCKSINRIRLKVNREKNRFKEQSLNAESVRDNPRWITVDHDKRHDGGSLSVISFSSC